jgi:hypothetical protein
MTEHAINIIPWTPHSRHASRIIPEHVLEAVLQLGKDSRVRQLLADLGSEMMPRPASQVVQRCRVFLFRAIEACGNAMMSSILTFKEREKYRTFSFSEVDLFRLLQHCSEHFQEIVPHLGIRLRQPNLHWLGQLLPETPLQNKRYSAIMHVWVSGIALRTSIALTIFFVSSTRHWSAISFKSSRSSASSSSYCHSVSFSWISDINRNAMTVSAKTVEHSHQPKYPP